MVARSGHGLLNMNESRQKVLIGIPTYEGHAFCREDFIANTVALAGSEIDVLVIWNGEGDPTKIFPSEWKTQVIKQKPTERGLDVLIRKHNIMNNRAIKGGYSHLFILESDVFPPHGTIEKLLAHDVDIVTALYFIRGESHLILEIPDNEKYREKYNGTMAGKTVLAVRDETAPAVWGIEGDEMRFWRIEDCWPQRGLVKIAAAGVGAVLIKTEVLRKVAWKQPPQEWAGHCDDFPFYHSAHFEHGFDAYVDTDIICQHLHDYSEDGDGLEVQQKWFKAKDLEPVGQRSCEHIFA